MEAAPRLPMICFNLFVSPEPTSFESALKQVLLYTNFVFFYVTWMLCFSTYKYFTMKMLRVMLLKFTHWKD